MSLSHLLRTLHICFRLSLHLQRGLLVVLCPRIDLADLVLSTGKNSLGQFLSLLAHKSALLRIANLARTLLGARRLAFARYRARAGVEASSAPLASRSATTARTSCARSIGATSTASGVSTTASPSTPRTQRSRPSDLR